MEEKISRSSNNALPKEEEYGFYSELSYHYDNEKDDDDTTNLTPTQAKFLVAGMVVLFIIVIAFCFMCGPDFG